MSETLRVHRFLARTRANGPGLRAALWLQGCSLGCTGCFNPETHDIRGGEIVSVAEAFDRLTSSASLEGVTLSGGEPLQQRRPVIALLERIRAQTSLTTILFTGFTWEEVGRMPEADRLLGSLDLLIAGRFERERRLRLAHGLRGSANKTVHLLTGRYTVADIEAVPACEVTIAPDGHITITGIDPLAWG